MSDGDVARLENAVQHEEQTVLDKTVISDCLSLDFVEYPPTNVLCILYTSPHLRRVVRAWESVFFPSQSTSTGAKDLNSVGIQHHTTPVQ